MRGGDLVVERARLGPIGAVAVKDDDVAHVELVAPVVGLAVAHARRRARVSHGDRVLSRREGQERRDVGLAIDRPLECLSSPERAAAVGPRGAPPADGDVRQPQ